MTKKVKLLKQRLMPLLAFRGFRYTWHEVDSTALLLIWRDDSQIMINLQSVRQLRVNKKHLVFFMLSGAEYLFYYPEYSRSNIN